MKWIALNIFLFFSFSRKRKKQRSSESGDLEDLSFIYNSGRQTAKNGVKSCLIIDAEVKAIYNLFLFPT